MKRLKFIRERRGLTQAQLAAMVSADQSQISKIERGDEAVSLSRIYAIAAALKVSPAELFEPSGVQDRVLRTIHRIPEERREMALRILESIAEDGPSPRRR
jgi:transcriptional regulator with XRE-family HTH domain